MACGIDCTCEECRNTKQFLAKKAKSGEVKLCGSPSDTKKIMCGLLILAVLLSGCAKEGDMLLVTGDKNVTNIIYDTNDSNKVGVDATATPDYIGATSGDGVLRTNSPMSYADGGDYVTLDVDDATTIKQGVASFPIADYDLIGATNEAQLKDTVVKSIVSDSGTATPSSHTFAISGGTGITTSATASTLTVTATGADENAIHSLDGVDIYGTANRNIDLVAGANITITPNNDANQITIASTGGSSAPDSNAWTAGYLSIDDNSVQPDLNISQNIIFPDTNDGQGNIMQGGNRILHFFKDNLFLGTNSGNYTLEGQGNTGFGPDTLRDLNQGINNTAQGEGSLRFLLNGSYNMCLGKNSCYRMVSASDTVCAGFNCLYNNVSGARTTAIGSYAGAGTVNPTNIRDSVLLGYRAGQFLPNETNNVFWLANTATTNALIYGEFPNDLIRINASLTDMNGSADVNADLNAARFCFDDSGCVDEWADVNINTNAETECSGDTFYNGEGGCVFYIESEVYFAYVISTESGTDINNNVAEATYSYDANAYTVQENSGASPLTVDINFGDVNRVDAINIREKYIAGSSHHLDFMVFNFANEEWDLYLEITDQSDYVVESISVFNSDEHISPDGNVWTRFEHIQNGNTSHIFYLDWIQIVKGATTVSSMDHDAMGMRDLNSNHPQYLLKVDVIDDTTVDTNETASNNWLAKSHWWSTDQNFFRGNFNDVNSLRGFFYYDLNATKGNFYDLNTGSGNIMHNNITYSLTGLNTDTNCDNMSCASAQFITNVTDAQRTCDDNTSCLITGEVATNTDINTTENINAQDLNVTNDANIGGNIYPDGNYGTAAGTSMGWTVTPCTAGGLCTSCNSACNGLGLGCAIGADFPNRFFVACSANPGIGTFSCICTN